MKLSSTIGSVFSPPSSLLLFAGKDASNAYKASSSSLFSSFSSFISAKGEIGVNLDVDVDVDVDVNSTSTPPSTISS